MLSPVYYGGHMRRVIATLGVIALVGGFAGTVSARGQRHSGVITIDTASRCDELGDLRQELARLEQHLQQLRAAFEEAKANGNRQRALQILQEIRRIEARIDDLQHKIRRLQQICKAN